jgi:hypothetical protein
VLLLLLLLSMLLLLLVLRALPCALLTTQVLHAPLPFQSHYLTH